MNFEHPCPGCKSIECINLGPINASNEFNGLRSDEASQTFSYLYKCKCCHLVYKAPCISNQDAISLYDNGVVEQYKATNRNDHKLIANYIECGQYSSVLDFGCYTGDLLSNITGVNKFGIEINSAAAKLAFDRTGALVYKDISEVTQKFDAIVMCDVIEHIDNPSIIIDVLCKYLNDDGILLLTTGNSSHITSRIQKNRWYYALNAEHISFINPSWVNKHCKESNLEVVKIEKFKYMNRSVAYELFNWIKSVVYLISPVTFNSLRNLLSNNNRVGEPGLGTWHDHIFVVIRKASK